MLLQSSAVLVPRASGLCRRLGVKERDELFTHVEEADLGSDIGMFDLDDVARFMALHNAYHDRENERFAVSERERRRTEAAAAVAAEATSAAASIASPPSSPLSSPPSSPPLSPRSLREEVALRRGSASRDSGVLRRLGTSLDDPSISLAQAPRGKPAKPSFASPSLSSMLSRKRAAAPTPPAPVDLLAPAAAPTAAPSAPAAPVRAPLETPLETTSGDRGVASFSTPQPAAGPEAETEADGPQSLKRSHSSDAPRSHFLDDDGPEVTPEVIPEASQEVPSLLRRFQSSRSLSLFGGAWGDNGASPEPVSVGLGSGEPASVAASALPLSADATRHVLLAPAPEVVAFFGPPHFTDTARAAELAALATRLGVASPAALDLLCDASTVSDNDLACDLGLWGGEVRSFRAAAGSWRKAQALRHLQRGVRAASIAHAWRGLVGAAAEEEEDRAEAEDLRASLLLKQAAHSRRDSSGFTRRAARF